VKNLVLASGSPRRRDLLQWCGYHPTVQPQQIDESPKPGELPVPYALRLAQEKAEASPESAIPVVAADTIVHMNETIYAHWLVAGTPSPRLCAFDRELTSIPSPSTRAYACVNSPLRNWNPTWIPEKATTRRAPTGFRDAQGPLSPKCRVRGPM